MGCDRRGKIGLVAVSLIVAGSLFQTSPALSAEGDSSAELAVSNAIFAVFDTETTGLSPKKDRIVEIGVVKYQNGKIIDQKSWLLYPGRKIPYYATRAHGITDEMVKGQPEFKDVADDFRAYVDGCVLMAHNARFDINFVNREFDLLGQSRLSNEVIDSLALFRQWYPELKSHKLKSVVDHVKVPDEGTFHRALADSVYVTRIFDSGLQPRHRLLQDVYNECGGPLTF